MPDEPHNPPSTTPGAASATPSEPGAGLPGGEPPHIPLAPHPQDAVPTARSAGPSIGEASILDLTEESCPNCGKAMKTDAVVCLACGYDLTANRVIRPAVGVEEIEPTKPAEDQRPEFVRPGGTAKLVGILGGIVLVGAGVCAGFTARDGSGWVVTGAMVVLAMYSGILHAATGVAAVWCASKYEGERFTKIDLVAARMLLGFATFLLVLNVPVHLPYEWLDKSLKFVLAVSVYFLMLMALFRRDRRVSLVLLGMHAAIWVFVQIGVLLGVVLQGAATPTPVKP